MQKMLQYFMELSKDTMPETVHELAKKNIPYVEVDLTDKWAQMINSYMSGVFLLLIDGYKKAPLWTLYFLPCSCYYT